jgi:diaminopropionate ammonia-lyase
LMSNNKGGEVTGWILNSHWNPNAPSVLGVRCCYKVFSEIREWPSYKETELRAISAASTLAVKNVFYKDESTRFGLGSFKALGAPYALSKELVRLLRARGSLSKSVEFFKEPVPSALKGITTSCASDGNHGRALAWASLEFGCACRVFIPSFVSNFRRKAIEKYGARIIVVPGTYDDAVSRVESESAKNSWLLIPDSGAKTTSIAATVMRGYTVISQEVLLRVQGPFTHCFVQAGVGGLAAAIADSLYRPGQQVDTKIIVVEPESAGGFFRSAAHSRLMSAIGPIKTIAGGLACATPSPLAWRILRSKAHAFMTVTDAQIIEAMKNLYEHGIMAGESGAVGYAGLIAAASNPHIRSSCLLNQKSSVLIIGTEGATDPKAYRELLAN